MIADIHIAASITSILSLGLIGGMLLLSAQKEERGFLLLLVLVMLPMNALAFYLVRMPLDAWLVSIAGAKTGAYPFIQTLYAPLTEEPAKLWPLLIPFFSRRIRLLPPHRAGLAIGLGFGVGEAWTVAHLLSQSPHVAQIPWYLLGGYIAERMMVCVMHGAFTTAALVLIVRHGRVFLGIAAAMLLHWIGNFPIFLAGMNFPQLGPQVWQVVLQLWVAGYFLLMGCLLARIALGGQWLRKLFRGNVRCPECSEIYQRPIFGINLLHKRCERCPFCKHWHLVSAFPDACAEKRPARELSGKTEIN